MPPVLQLWFGALLLSFAPVFVKALPALGPTAIGFYRCFLAAGLLVPFLFGGKAPRAEAGLSRRFLFWSALAGLIFAVDLFVWHRSVLLAGAGLGTILGNTQVFYLTAVGVLFHSEKLTPRFLVAVGLAAVGTYLLVDPAGHPSRTDGYWTGVGWGLLTGMVYASYVAVLKSLEALRYPRPLGFRLFAVSGFTALFLALFQVAEGDFPLPSGGQWVWLFVLAGVVQVGGWFCIQRNLKSVSVSRVGLLLLTQPVGATLWGVLFFAEKLKPSQAAGAAMTLFAVYLGNTRNKAAALKPATLAETPPGPL
jgi:drug/metabolite transporter (DMT)-like permease